MMHIILSQISFLKNCIIYPKVTIREECVLKDYVILQPGAVIGSDGFGYVFINKHEKIPQIGKVILQDDVEIGANSTVDRATIGTTLIEKGVKIDNLVQIGHNVVVGKHTVIVAQTGIAGSSKIGDYVTVAAQVGIAGHISVGDKAVLFADELDHIVKATTLRNFDVGIVLTCEFIRNVFHKQKGEDIIFILRGIHAAS